MQRRGNNERLNGASDEDAVELVGVVKEQQSNGRLSHEATDGEVWEAGDSGSDDGLTQQTVSISSPARRFYPEYSLIFRLPWKCSDCCGMCRNMFCFRPVASQGRMIRNTCRTICEEVHHTVRLQRDSAALRAPMLRTENPRAVQASQI